MHEHDIDDVIDELLHARIRGDRAELMALMTRLCVAPPAYIAGVVAVMAAEVAPWLPKHEAGFRMLPPHIAERMPPVRLTFLRMAAAMGNDDPGLARDLGVVFLEAGGWPARSQLIGHALGQLHYLHDRL